MLDGVDAGFHGIVHALQRHGMRRHRPALAVRFIHDGAQLIKSKSGNVVQDLAVHRALVGTGSRLKVVAAIYIHFDPIGAVRNLLAHCFAAIVCAVA